jgi:hypothetical protein
VTGSYTSAPVEQSGRTPDQAVAAPSRRLSTETKSSFKTTEFWLYVVAADHGARGQGHGQPRRLFSCRPAWFYVVLLTLGYLGCRRLAKSGSRDHYDAETLRDHARPAVAGWARCAAPRGTVGWCFQPDA